MTILSETNANCVKKLSDKKDLQIFLILILINIPDNTTLNNPTNINKNQAML